MAQIPPYQIRTRIQIWQLIDSIKYHLETNIVSLALLGEILRFQLTAGACIDKTSLVMKTIRRHTDAGQLVLFLYHNPNLATFLHCQLADIDILWWPTDHISKLHSLLSYRKQAEVPVGRAKIIGYQHHNILTVILRNRNRVADGGKTAIKNYYK